MAGLSMNSLMPALARTLPPAILCMTAVGIFASIQLTTSNSHLQMASPPALRGRIVSLYVWTFQGTTPAGGFLAGWAAEHFGIPHAVLGAGLVCLLAGLGLGLTLAPRDPG